MMAPGRAVPHQHPSPIPFRAGFGFVGIPRVSGQEEAEVKAILLGMVT